RSPSTSPGMNTLGRAERSCCSRLCCIALCLRFKHDVRFRCDTHLRKPPCIGKWLPLRQNAQMVRDGYSAAIHCWIPQLIREPGNAVTDEHTCANFQLSTSFSSSSG